MPGPSLSPPNPHLSWLPFSFSAGLRILIVKMRFFEFLPLFMPFWVNQYYTNLLIPNLPVYRPGLGIGSVLADPTSEWMLVRRHCPRLSSDSQVNTGLRSHGSVFSRGSNPFMQSLTRQMIEMQLQGKKGPGSSDGSHQQRG